MRIFKQIGGYIVLFLVVLGIYSFLNAGGGAKEVTYTEVISQIKSGNVTQMVINDRDVTCELKTELDGSKTITAEIPSIAMLNANANPELQQAIDNKEITIKTPAPQTNSWLSSLFSIVSIGIFLLMIWMLFMQSSGGGAGGRGVMGFGKTKAKLAENTKHNVTFEKVAGADEEKQELEEIVQFLKAPARFSKLGARIPKGVLLVGPPGTGKTLLAKAVAGEAKVPFFSISGSDFVEMFVGVGASRVRDLFEQAKKCMPCIVFIDEIDAVGRHRGAGMGGGHDEREQTLNQLLVEMDGFGENSGIIVMAATNRPDILDPALLRPGRFDRQIVVSYPDIKGREEILKVHAVNKPIGNDVNLKTIAKTTAGFTGADLENLLNEAALLAARRNQTAIHMPDVEEAMIKVIAGPEKKSKVVSEHERKITAYHEAGHAVVAKNLPTADPVHQVSIIARGRAGGYTLSLPKEDKNYQSKKGMEEEIVSLLGGRVAEKIILDDISTGASNDIERATAIARGMVTKYGMSEKLGPLAFGSSNDEIFLGRDFGHTRDYSEKVAAEIDEEVRSIIGTAYDKCEKTLKEHLTQLTNVAKALLLKEKLEEDEFELIYKQETELTDDEINALIDSIPREEIEYEKQPEEPVVPEVPTTEFVVRNYNGQVIIGRPVDVQDNNQTPDKDADSDNK